MSLSPQEWKSRRDTVVADNPRLLSPDLLNKHLKDNETKVAEWRMTHPRNTNTTTRTSPFAAKKARLPFLSRIRVIGNNLQKQFGKGHLYAGWIPSLWVAAPATGVYYGFRDVTKRTLTLSDDTFAVLHMSDWTVAVLATLVASVASTAIRTPVDALSTRLQVARINDRPNGTFHNHQEEEEEEERISHEQVGDWFTESLERLPVLVVTDVPYLLCRVVLNGALDPRDAGLWSIRDTRHCY